jgi:hypothetical protein
MPTGIASVQDRSADDGDWAWFPNQRVSAPQPPKFGPDGQNPRKNHERIVKKWREMALFRGPEAPFRPARSRSRSSTSHSFSRLYIGGTRLARPAKSPKNRVYGAIFESSEVQTDDSAVAGRGPIRRDAARPAAPKTLRLIRPAGDTDTPPCRRRCRGVPCPAGRLGNLKWVVRAPQRIHLLLSRKVKLANWVGRKSDVSLGPASERKIFSKTRLGAELRAPGRRAAVKIGNLAELAGVSTRTPVAPWQWPDS